MYMRRLLRLVVDHGTGGKADVDIDGDTAHSECYYIFVARNRDESMWMAGGGVKGGTVYGATDEFGYHATENRVTMADFHATVLHVLGLDFERLSFHHDTRDEKLTDVRKAQVVRGILG